MKKLPLSGSARPFHQVVGLLSKAFCGTLVPSYPEATTVVPADKLCRDASPQFPAQWKVIPFTFHSLRKSVVDCTLIVSRNPSALGNSGGSGVGTGSIGGVGAGADDGADVGAKLGNSVGLLEGKVEGAADGTTDDTPLGSLDARSDGLLLGYSLGFAEGSEDGDRLGTPLGASDGDLLGAADGNDDGVVDGSDDGSVVGAGVAGVGGVGDDGSLAVNGHSLAAFASEVAQQQSLLRAESRLSQSEVFPLKSCWQYR